ncbi:MAG TPA: ornithine cyclodeaminase family protein [Streptosporangiaceae bacterium]|jgi:ornithine cyclodeaminase
MRVLVLSHADVLAALPPQACEQAMAAVLAAHGNGETFMPLRSVMAPPGAAGFMGLMPAWRGRPGGSGQRGGEAGPPPDGAAAAFALKTVCIIPANPARGLDAHQGLVTLFDAENGQPTAIMDASAITAVRTAAVSAVATRALASPGARTLAILGAGTQARAHLTALARVRDFDRVLVYAPTAQHAEAVAGQAAGQGWQAAAAPSAQAAVQDADVVVTATSAREPVLQRAWLKPGAHVNAVGASTPRNREIDTATVAASALYCDSRESLRSEAGEFALAIAEGLIDGDRHVRGELGEVLAGTAPGRRDEDELTMFRSLGLAVEDLAAAQTAVATARARGLGTEVEL